MLSKYGNDSIASPRQQLDYYKTLDQYPDFSPPDGVVICYQRYFWDHICSLHPAPAWEGPLRGISGMRLIEKDGHTIGVMGGFGMGAPAVCYVLEQLIAFGVTRFVSMGIAGVLQKHIDIGDIIVCNRALRDEGTSHHYLPPSRFAQADEKLCLLLQDVLTSKGINHLVGASWTTDAVYRETVGEVRQYQQEGIITVEMEASALFSVASYRKVQVGCILSASDSLADYTWAPHLGSEILQKTLKVIFEVSVETLSIAASSNNTFAIQREAKGLFCGLIEPSVGMA